MSAKLVDNILKGKYLMEQGRERKIIGVQVPDFLLKPLEEEAEKLGLSISAMIRLILAKRYRDDAKFNDVEGN